MNRANELACSLVCVWALQLLGAAVGSASTRVQLEGHLLYKEGRIFFSDNQDAGLPVYEIKWRKEPDSGKLCFRNINRLCPKFRLSCEKTSKTAHSFLAESCEIIDARTALCPASGGVEAAGILFFCAMP